MSDSKIFEIFIKNKNKKKMSETESTITIKKGTSKEAIEEIYRNIKTDLKLIKINVCFGFSEHGDVEIGSKDGRVYTSPNVPTNPLFYESSSIVEADKMLLRCLDNLPMFQMGVEKPLSEEDKIKSYLKLCKDTIANIDYCNKCRTTPYNEDEHVD